METIKKQDSNPNEENKSYITSKELMWIGLGGIIGAGFFLASGLPIKYAGPGVIFAYILGGLITTHIAGALVMLSVNNPEGGSFQSYAKNYLGSFMGFYVGWIFWISSILTIGSEVLAMAIFSKLWFPNIPLGILTTIYAVIVIVLNSIGLKSFSKIETIMSFVKVSVLALFIVIGLVAIIGLINTTRDVGFDTLLKNGGLFPNGFNGFVQSLLIVIFAFAGLGAVVFASSEVKDSKHDVPKAMNKLLLILISLYVISITVVLCLVPWNTIGTNESPFVTALTSVNLPFITSLMNAVILIAAFSVMIGSYYAAIMALVGLGKEHSAPAFVAKKNKKGAYPGSVLLTAIGLAIIIIVSYLLPGKIYDYIIGASSYFALLTLGILLISFLLWKRSTKGKDIYKSRLAFGAPWTSLIVLLIFIILLVYSLRVDEQRVGFYFSLGISGIVALAYLFIQRLKD